MVVLKQQRFRDHNKIYDRLGPRLRIQLSNLLYDQLGAQLRYQLRKTHTKIYVEAMDDIPKVTT